MRAKTLIACLAFLMTQSPALAADEPTLNDLPKILKSSRGCRDASSFLGGTSTVCLIPEREIWVSVSSDGGVSIYRSSRYRDTIYASGASISEMLRAFATRLNADSADNKMMLEAIAPLLPSQ